MLKLLQLARESDLQRISDMYESVTSETLYCFLFPRDLVWHHELLCLEFLCSKVGVCIQKPVVCTVAGGGKQLCAGIVDLSPKGALVFDSSCSDTHLHDLSFLGAQLFQTPHHEQQTQLMCSTGQCVF